MQKRRICKGQLWDKAAFEGTSDPGCIPKLCEGYNCICPYSEKDLVFIDGKLSVQLDPKPGADGICRDFEPELTLIGEDGSECPTSFIDDFNEMVPFSAEAEEEALREARCREPLLNLESLSWEEGIGDEFIEGFVGGYVDGDDEILCDDNPHLQIKRYPKEID